MNESGSESESGTTPEPEVELDRETRRVRDYWDGEAGRWEQSSVGSSWLLADGREWACSQAIGETLEIAVGTGRNLSHYPPGVYVTGVEISPNMLALARARAARLGIQADLREGDAQALAFVDEQFDCAVCTLSLCSIPDHDRAVREVWRVLRPGAAFVLLEHVRSPNPVVHAIERLFEQVTVRREGEHLTREPQEALLAAGFAIEYVARSRLGIIERVIARKRT